MKSVSTPKPRSPLTSSDALILGGKLGQRSDECLTHRGAATSTPSSRIAATNSSPCGAR